MPSPVDLEKLAELMRSSSFSGESRFYRQTLPEFLTPTDEAGVFRVSANDDPSEAVIDIYAGHHVCLARSERRLGRGHGR